MEPSERTTMKSPRVSFSKATSPRRMSWNTVRPSGTRTRSVYGSPAACRRATSSAARSRHVPGYTQPPPSAWAAARSASSRSALQKHG